MVPGGGAGWWCRVAVLGGGADLLGGVVLGGGAWWWCGAGGVVLAVWCWVRAFVQFCVVCILHGGVLCATLQNARRRVDKHTAACYNADNENKQPLTGGAAAQKGGGLQAGEGGTIHHHKHNRR